MISKGHGGIIQRIQCKTVEEFLNAISPRGPYFKRYPPEDIIYRGLPRAQYKLLPSIFRPTARLKLDGKWVLAKRLPPILFLWAEIETVHEFCRRADRSGLPLPTEIYPIDDYFNGLRGRMGENGWAEWPPEELMPVIGLAQHHGVPSRFLDWTRSPYVAAYFAAVGVAREIFEVTTNKRRKIRRVNPGRGQLTVWALALRGLRYHMFSSFKFGEGGPKIRLITVPRSGNQNIHAQHGVFTLCIPSQRSLSLQSLKSMSTGTSFDALIQRIGLLASGPTGHLLKFMLPSVL